MKWLSWSRIKSAVRAFCRKLADYFYPARNSNVTLVLIESSNPSTAYIQKELVNPINSRRSADGLCVIPSVFVAHAEVEIPARLHSGMFVVRERTIDVEEKSTDPHLRRDNQLSWKDLLYFHREGLVLRYVERTKGRQEFKKGGSGDFISLATFAIPPQDYPGHEVFMNKLKALYPHLAFSHFNGMDDSDYRYNLYKALQDEKRMQSMNEEFEKYKVILLNHMKECLEHHIRRGLQLTSLYYSNERPCLILAKKNPYQAAHHANNFNEGYRLGKFGTHSFSAEGLLSLIELEEEDCVSIPPYPGNFCLKRIPRFPKNPEAYKEYDYLFTEEDQKLYEMKERRELKLIRVEDPEKLASDFAALRAVHPTTEIYLSADQLNKIILTNSTHVQEKIMQHYYQELEKIKEHLIPKLFTKLLATLKTFSQAYWAQQESTVRTEQSPPFSRNKVA